MMNSDDAGRAGRAREGRTQGGTGTAAGRLARRRVLSGAAVLGAGALGIAACSPGEVEPAGSGTAAADAGAGASSGTDASAAAVEASPGTLRIIAGSEIADMGDVLAEMTAQTGVEVALTYRGTLAGTDELIEDASPYDAAWFPSNQYLSLLPTGAALVADSASIMSSPVVLGLKPSAAGRLGWTAEAPPSWAQILAAVDAGTLSYGMTSPVSSNSGFSTLVAAATALRGTGVGIAAADVTAIAPQLTRFAAGQDLASGSSGWLLEAFLDAPDAVDGIFVYESLLRGVDLDGQDLVILIPTDGVITSDYPLTLLTGADDDTAERFAAMTAYLQSDAAQALIAEKTLRRTRTSAAAEGQAPVELPLPTDVATLRALLGAWVSDLRKPASSVFQLDTSGSMEGDRLAQLQEALGVLSGATQGTQTEQLLTLQARESITVVEFADAVKSETVFVIPAEESARGAVLEQIDALGAGLVAEGGTAIFDALVRSLEIAADRRSEDVISSVVVFTDGENTDGLRGDEFAQEHAQHEEWQGIPVFTIAFGDAEQDQLSQIAELTGGRLFSSGAGLAAVFRDIRGYQ